MLLKAGQQGAEVRAGASLGAHSLPAWSYAALALAVILPRLLFALLAPATGGDADVYLRVAQNIFANQCVSLSDPTAAACVPHWGGNHYPGLPAFIALSYLLLGQSLLSPLLLQVVVTAAAILRLATAAARYSGSASMGIVVGAVAALSPLQVAWSRFVLTEALVLALATWLLAELLLSLHQRRLRVLTIAIPLTAMAFVRHDGVLFAVAVPIVAFAVHPPATALLRTAAVGAVAAAPLLLWAMRGVALGLSFVPPTLQLADGSPAPAGYAEWRRTWEITSYQAARSQYPVNTLRYDTIGIDSVAYARGDDPDADKARVRELLAGLADATGRPFPAAIDLAFRELAAERRASDPLRYWVVLPLRRTLHMWFDPLTSTGWPAEIGSVRLEAVAEQTERGGVAALLAVALQNPVVAAIKALVSGYRALVVVALVLVCLGSRRVLGEIPIVVTMAVAVFLTRTVFFVGMLAVQSRYLVGAMPFVETAIVLSAAAAFAARGIRRRGTHNPVPSTR